MGFSAEDKDRVLFAIARYRPRHGGRYKYIPESEYDRRIAEYLRDEGMVEIQESNNFCHATARGQSWVKLGGYIGERMRIQKRLKDKERQKLLHEWLIRVACSVLSGLIGWLLGKCG